MRGLIPCEHERVVREPRDTVDVDIEGRRNSTPRRAWPGQLLIPTDDLVVACRGVAPRPPVEHQGERLVPDEAVADTRPWARQVTRRDWGGLAQLLARPLPPGGVRLLRDIMSRESRNNSVYVSTPITTGHDYLIWLAENPDRTGAAAAAHQRSTVRSNLARAEPLVAAVRAAALGAQVIDPTQLKSIPTWAQADYHRYWAEVIERAVSRVVFADGWQYSIGCTVEFAVATMHDLPLFDARLQVMYPADGIRHLYDARPLLLRAGVDATLHQAAVATLERHRPTVVPSAIVGRSRAQG